MDIYAEIYPCVIDSFSDKESIVDKRGLCIQSLGVIDYVLDCMRTKILTFQDHDVIEDSHRKLMAVYNPLSHFYQWFVSDDVPQCHATTSFNMNYIEYRQREIFLLSSDIFWLSDGIRKKFILTCIMYKKLDLLAKISTKSSKVIQKWAVQYDLYK